MTSALVGCWPRSLRDLSVVSRRHTLLGFPAMWIGPSLRASYVRPALVAAIVQVSSDSPAAHENETAARCA